jgi:hypothetical protein
MFNVAVWGTVGQWISGMASSGALIVGATVLAIDLHRKRREQAVSVIALFNPGIDVPTIGIQNLSNHPIFQYGYVAMIRPDEQLEKIIAANAKRDEPQDFAALADVEGDCFVVFLSRWFEDDFVLNPGEEKKRSHNLHLPRQFYDFYIFFTDAYGRRWVKDARTNRVLNRRDTKRIHPNESILKDQYDWEI